MEFDAVLLDVDGTLVDSNDAHASAWVDAFLERDIRIDFKVIRKRIGMGGDHLMPSVSGIEKESEIGASIDARRGEIFREKYLPRLRAFPGTRELLAFLRERGIKLIVATSASEEDLDAILKRAGIEKLVDDATNSSETERSKPDPDIVKAALEKSKLPRDRVVMIGDTPYDIQAAHKAGVRTIAFTCGGWDRNSLREADAIFDGPWDLLESLERSRALEVDGTLALI